MRIINIDCCFDSIHDDVLWLTTCDNDHDNSGNNAASQDLSRSNDDHFVEIHNGVPDSFCELGHYKMC